MEGRSLKTPPPFYIPFYQKGGLSPPLEITLLNKEMHMKVTLYENIPGYKVKAGQVSCHSCNPSFLKAEAERQTAAEFETNLSYTVRLFQKLRTDKEEERKKDNCSVPCPTPNSSPLVSVLCC